MKKIIIVAGLVVGLAGLVMAGSLVADAQPAPNQAREKEFRIERSMPRPTSTASTAKRQRSLMLT